MDLSEIQTALRLESSLTQQRAQTTSANAQQLPAPPLPIIHTVTRALTPTLTIHTVTRALTGGVRRQLEMICMGRTLRSPPQIGLISFSAKR